MKRYFLIAAACALACVSCHNHHEEHAGHDEHEGHDHGDEIVLSAERAGQAGIKVSTVQPGPFTAAVKTSGTVVAAEAAVTASTSGILSWNGSVPVPGQRVPRGQVLAYLSGRDLVEGDAAEKAEIAYEKALKEYARAKTLAESRIISEREFEAAKAEFALAESARRGLSGRSGAKGVAQTVPVSGSISRIYKQEGDYAAVGEPIAAVVKNGTLRLQAELPEKYAALRGRIEAAEYRLAYGGVQRTGRLLAVSGDLGASPYLTLTFALPDAAEALPGSHAEVWLATGTWEDVISVPETALTEEQGEFFVYVQVDEDGYRKTRVTPGSRNGTSVEILSGLTGGEALVTEGAYQVKLAAASVIPGHSHEH